MSQWGSKYLGDQGSSAIEILRYYYGSSMYINEAEEISGIPASWPGYNLSTGASGPRIAADGNYGPATEGAVRAFQSTFGLPVTGIIDYRTWYKISELYVAITRIAELY